MVEHLASDIHRNYDAEARAIIDERGLLLPERAHLLALDAQLQAMNRNVILLGHLLLAVLYDSGQPAMSMPKALLETVKKLNLMPLIHAQPDGSIVVKAVPLGPVPTNGNGKVTVS